jgi:uncharacterized membrane protein YoaK (UPF0700 family)
MAIESDFFGRPANAYAAALFGEAALLVTFTATSSLTPAVHPRLLDLEAAILCGAMGMQNSLVTRLSGAVVRTTHLTGVFTDIGIESARWFRWWRQSLSRGRLKLVFGVKPPEKPSAMKIWLLLTIAGSFAVGAILGATLGLRLRHGAMLLPSVAVAVGGLNALLNGRSAREPTSSPPSSRRRVVSDSDVSGG